jgi:hypothetical protein
MGGATHARQGHHLRHRLHPCRDEHPRYLSWTRSTDVERLTATAGRWPGRPWAGSARWRTPPAQVDQHDAARRLWALDYTHHTPGDTWLPGRSGVRPRCAALVVVVVVVVVASLAACATDASPSSSTTATRPSARQPVSLPMIHEPYGAGRVRMAQLVMPRAGWALTTGRLAWPGPPTVDRRPACSVTPHGWMSTVRSTVAAAGGGRRSAPPRRPTPTPLAFTAPTEGWVAGDFERPDLYVIHDGARTWQRRPLPPPPGRDRRPIESGLGLPRFFDDRDGALPRSLADRTQPGPSLVVYRTRDGGTTWTPGRPLMLHGGFALARLPGAVAIIGPREFAVLALDGTRLARTTDGAGGGRPSQPPGCPRASPVGELAHLRQPPPGMGAHQHRRPSCQ